jgi:hypothetical protein
VKKIKLLILRNEQPGDHLRWVAACRKYSDQVDFEIVDLSRSDWLERVARYQPDMLLTKPGGLTSSFKQLYDERLMILSKVLGYACYPSLGEVLIYENKRYFSYWLRAYQLPHPQTDAFYFQDEAVEFVKHAVFPLVAKVNIGASGSGVQLLHNSREAIDYIVNAFKGKGAAKRSGPNLQKGGLIKRGLHYVMHPGKIAAKLQVYKARSADMQNSFVLLQEYVAHDFEWRAVRIGDSFFAHKKLKMGEKASGSLLKNYDNPPLSILDFVKEVTDRFNFYSQAVDIFETGQGYLINEMQCIFGQSDPYQMLIDGKPGRYINKSGKWFFEEGDFNTNESYDLRLQTAIDLHYKNK